MFSLASQMVQWWGDYLDEAKAENKVVAGKFGVNKTHETDIDNVQIRRS